MTMIKFANGGRLVQAVHELPDVHAKQVFIDLETTSGGPKLTSLNPWHHCSIAGICITYDDCPTSWYIPIGHNDTRWNIDRDAVLRWANSITYDEWINHNVKYDAHVWANAGLRITGKLTDTMTLSKIIDSDRVTKGGYGLKALSRTWLNAPPYTDRVDAFVKGANTKDYGDCPADILGEYGCQDVITARSLYHYVMDKMPESCLGVCETECLLTPVLFDMERVGLHVNQTELKVAELKTLRRMFEIEQWLHEVTGEAIRPHVNNDCFDVLCNKYGLPILGRTDTGNPSFDKAALNLYLADPHVLEDKKLHQVIEGIIEYRKLNTLNSLFLEPYQEFAVGGIMHSSYNQAVRTGRMSCSSPNMQQLSKLAKTLVHPAPGYGFISADYSQVEFRLIIHYIENEAAIRAYAEDPDTDFHNWVAEMCGIPRRPAKNVNFAIGYGGGRNLILEMLSTNADLVSSLVAVAAGNHNRFKMLCRERAESVYRQYHSTLPELKRTSDAAARSARRKGFVFNAYGRHRHLNERMAHIAFNGVIQSSAADLMKERTVASSPRHDTFLRNHNVTQVASVHDETLFQAPLEVLNDPAVLTHIRNVLESPAVEFRVPIRVDIGTASTCWADCTSDENIVKLER